MKIFCFLFLLSFWQISSAFLADSLKPLYADRTLIALGDAYLPPLEYLDESGNPVGFNVDLFDAVMKKLGIKYELRLGNWSTVLQEAENNQADILIGMTNSAERSEQFVFPSRIAF